MDVFSALFSVQRIIRHEIKWLNQIKWIVRERQLRLYGHVAQLPVEDLAHRILFCRDPRGWSMPKGRPKASWLHQVESYLRNTGMAAWRLPGRWPGRDRRSTVARWTQGAPAYAPIPDLNYDCLYWALHRLLQRSYRSTPSRPSYCVRRNCSSRCWRSSSPSWRRWRSATTRNAAPCRNNIVWWWINWWSSTTRKNSRRRKRWKRKGRIGRIARDDEKDRF